MDDNFIPDDEYIRLSNIVRNRKMNSLCLSNNNKKIPHNSQPNPIQYENKEEKRKRRNRNLDDENQQQVKSEECFRNTSYKPCGYSYCAMPVDYIDMFKYLISSDYNLLNKSEDVEEEEVDKGEVIEPTIREESE